ncbi:MAG TPA: 50S ribosomal protein L10, partial [Planctomycetota bacterium]|nr:50S ribosomal protein L10 [Planctomycetota bacterium]
MPSLINQLAARELRATFESADGLVVVGVQSLTVKETEGLRDALAQHGVRLRVVPNRVALAALRECGLEFPDTVFAGSIALAAGTSEQAIAAAKLVDRSTLRKAGKIALRAGVLEGAVLGAADAAALADVPDRDTLRAMLLGLL